jgi:phage terminase large subunit-like protein
MTEDREIGSCIYDYPEQIGVAVGFKDLKPIHGEWIRDIVWGDGDYTLMAHRGSFKSSCLAVAISLIMVIYPTINIIFLRKADNDVSEMIRMVKKILQSSVMRDICAVFHDGAELELTEDAQDHISTNLWTSPMGASQLLGIGLKSSITGKHADLVITDDICNVTDRISKAERDRTKIQYQELQNIRNRGGRIINLGTKWHKDDVFSLMDNIHVYDYKQTGLITEEKARELRDSMTAALFACNYELKIIADDDLIFVSPRVGGDPAMVEQGICHIDAAYGGSDYTAFTILRKKDGQYYVLGKLWHKAVDDVIDEIIALRKRFMAGKIYCEDNADKGYLAKDLRKRGERVVSYSEHENKYIKIVTKLKPEWKNILFVDGTDNDYIDMICDFNEDAEHDDAPDSLASLIRVTMNKDSTVDASEKYHSVYGGIYG